MIVTQHACHTALFRLLEELDMVGCRAWIELHRLELEWKRRCGLRRADLQRAISELCESGILAQRDDGEGVKIEITARGALFLMERERPLGRFDRSRLLAGLFEALRTASVLRRALRRTTRPGARVSGARAAERRPVA